MNRRTFLGWTVAVSAHGLLESASVLNFGVVGDGKTDASGALQRAVDSGEGLLYFPRGTYRLTRTVRLDLAKCGFAGLVGTGAAQIVMEGEGPAFHLVGSHKGTADPATMGDGVWSRERFPLAQGLEIVGKSPKAEGLVLEGTVQATLVQLLIRNCENGIRLSVRNRNTLISQCHVYNNRVCGILFDRVNLHQCIIGDCHISYNKRAGIHVDGGEVRNLQVVGNDIEYNHDDEGSDSADILIDVREGNSTFRECTVVGNTIQASPSPGGANVRILGGPGFRNTGLITLASNVLGSQSENIHFDQCRGIALTGNTIYGGSLRSVRIERCASILLSGNTLDSVVHREAWQRNPDPLRALIDGLLIRNSRGIQVIGLIAPRCLAGTRERGGAVEVEGSEDVSIANCQLLDAEHRGVVIVDSRRCHVSGCTIVDQRQPSTLIHAIEVLGASQAVVLSGNIVPRGKVHTAAGDAVLQNNVEV